MKFLVLRNRRLGGGAEGEVYVGCAPDGRLCAIKIPQGSLGDARAIVRHEVLRLKRAAGPGVVVAMAWNFTSDRPFIAYELARESLQHEMRRVFKAGDVYGPEWALRRVRDLLDCVADVHARGLVHRDIKPGNVLLFPNGRLKLGDFGAGRSNDRPTEMQTNGFVGTYAYAAPEQRNEQSVRAPADVFAVGMILYEMLMGYRPWEGGNGFVPPSHRWANVGVAVDQLLESMLARDPRARPSAASAADRADLLASAYQVLALAC